MSALDEKQCRRTFHLDRPECRACAGYDTGCPDYAPIRPEKETPEQEEHCGP